MRRALMLTFAVLLLSVEDASADGLPIVDFGQRPDSVALPGGDQRVMLVPAGDERTVVARVRGPRVGRSALLEGTWAIPAVAYDGTAGGAAADGRTLTLISPRERFPRKTTELALLGPDLRVRRRIELDGDFSFDAVSPDGSALFLVEYPDKRDPSVYRVRVFDVDEGRLERKPLIDSRAAAIVMRGLPITRATAPAGDVEYTLYDGLGDPFIHALDTQQRSALCIPLPRPPRRRWIEMRLDMSDDGRTLAVNTDTEPFALVDTQTNTARRPAAPWSLVTGLLAELQSYTLATRPPGASHGST